MSNYTYNITSCTSTRNCSNASTEYNNVTVSLDPVNEIIVIKSNMTLPENESFTTSIVIDSKIQGIVKLSNVEIGELLPLLHNIIITSHGITSCDITITSCDITITSRDVLIHRNIQPSTHRV